MSIQKNDKLNQLQILLPEEAIVSSRWLQDRGYSRQLLYRYVKSNWLKSVGGGNYSRQTTEITWQGLIASLQQINKNSLHVGAETALNLQGFAHYLRLKGEKQIFVFTESPAPSWVKSVPLDNSLQFIHKQLFAKQEKTGLTKIPSPVKNWPLILSTPERAILESLLFVKDAHSFTFAAELMEGLTILRPRIVNALLKNCKHIGVKRLFMFLAEYHNHPWFNKIEKQSLELGHGQRAIIAGGKLNKKYLITVPEKFHD